MNARKCAGQTYIRLITLSWRILRLSALSCQNKRQRMMLCGHTYWLKWSCLSLSKRLLSLEGRRCPLKLVIKCLAKRLLSGKSRGWISRRLQCQKLFNRMTGSGKRHVHCLLRLRAAHSRNTSVFLMRRRELQRYGRFKYRFFPVCWGKQKV
jgi:hypothetical protein